MKKYLSTRFNEGSGSLGLLILRLAAGGLMIHHGFEKLTHFSSVKDMSQLLGSPIDGILLVFAEFFCSAFLILGLFTRFACIPLIIAMAVAFFKAHNGSLSGQNSGETALLYLCCFLALLFTGPGKYSVDGMIAK
jgi:putative oxidoreductase